VTLAVALVNVSKTVELVRQRKNGLREHLPRLAVYRELPLVRPTDCTSDTYDVTTVSPSFEVLRGAKRGRQMLGEERSDELKVLFLNIMGGDAVKAALQLDLAFLAEAEHDI